MEKNFINARIRELRKHLKLSQTEFGERIGLKSGAIGKMEKDGGTVIDQNITLICEKYNVSREWLTEGTGDMFTVTEDSLFAEFSRKYSLTDEEQTAARFFLRLTSEERAAALKYIRELAAELDAKDAAREKEAEREELHRRLDEELDKEKAEPSASSSGNYATAEK